MQVLMADGKILMRTLFATILAIASIALVAPVTNAGPLDELRVTSDTKWLVHLDFDSFRHTQVGDFVNETLLGEHRDKIRSDFKRDFNFDLDWDKIKSITAFGSDYQIKPDQAGLMLIRTEPELQANFHQLLESKVDAGFGPLKIQPIKSEVEHLYAIAGELYIAVEPQGLFLLGKSRKQVETAKSVLAASSTPVQETEAFADYAELPNSMIFLAVADAFGEFNGLPAEARVLQLSKGGRLALCETDEDILLQLELKTKDKKTSRQIHSIVQGLLTLAMLGSEDERLTELAEAINVSSGDAIVTLKLELPIERALGTLKRFSK